jgi:hypothetical protein
MKRILAVVLALLGGVCSAQMLQSISNNVSHAGGGSNHTFALVHDTYKNTCGGGASCVITVPATGTGNLLVAVELNSGSATISSGTNGGTWVHCTGCQQFDASAGSTDMAYVLASTAGVTSITITNAANVGAFFAIRLLEYSYTNGPIAFDVAGVADRTTCTACAGITLTLTGTQLEAIIQSAVPTNAFTAVSGTYTNPADFTDGGIAGSLNTSSGTGPTWTQNTTGTAAMSAIAFK